jgi:hypothetical protein
LSDLELFKKLDQGDDLAELDAIVAQLRGPVRKPGDIDSYQIMARYGGTEKTAKALMQRIAKETGKYEYIKVWDEGRDKPVVVCVLRPKGEGDV